jgi:hypothetical protein
MLCTLVLTVLGTSMLALAVTEYRMEAAHRSRVKAYYLAEAGIEKAVFDITRLDRINTGSIRNTLWEMDARDSGLVEPGAGGGFLVTVEKADLFDVLFTGEGEDTEVYKRIFDIVLKSLADYNGTTVGVEARMLVEDYEEDDMENKVQVYHWRQIRGVDDED